MNAAQSSIGISHCKRQALQPGIADSVTSIGATSISVTSITELVLTKHSPDQAMVLLPMIAHLTRNSDRWTTWIVDHRFNKDQLHAFGIDTRKLQILYAPAGEDSRWIIWEALNSGTSECVIGTPGTLSEQELQHMESAAHNGDCRGLMISYK